MGEQLLQFIPVDTGLGGSLWAQFWGGGVQAQLEVQMVGPEASGGDGFGRAS